MDNRKEKKFINLPQYPGGKAAFQEFIRKNLRYPKEALEKKIEGAVYVMYKVDGLGNILEVNITKGVGHGCDEEAARVIRLLKYDKAKNRRLRVIAKMRTTIKFKLPKAKIQYEYKTEKKKPAEQATKSKGNQEQTYGYTISF